MGEKDVVIILIQIIVALIYLRSFPSPWLNLLNTVDTDTLPLYFKFSFIAEKYRDTDITDLLAEFVHIVTHTLMVSGSINAGIFLISHFHDTESIFSTAPRIYDITAKNDNIGPGSVYSLP